MFRDNTRRVLAPLSRDEMRQLAGMITDAAYRAGTSATQAGHFTALKIPQKGMSRELFALMDDLQKDVKRRDRRYR